MRSNGTSEQKFVVDRQQHDDLIPKYLKILEKLQKNYPIKYDLKHAYLVNFEKNKDLPIHRWFYYKQGYSAELVRELLSKSHTLNPEDYILDPFCGVGTTQVTAQSLGMKSVGLEVNPIASFASEVKTCSFNESEIKKIKKTLKDINALLQTSKSIPKYKKLKAIFEPSQLTQILKIKGFYENIKNRKIQKFFKLAYISIIENCSNRTKDGNGIKIAKNKQPVTDVIDYYMQKCQTMLTDLQQRTSSADSLTIHGSILQDTVFTQLRSLPIRAVMFSPPYANCFDYCEVSKMEIWLGDFVHEYRDFDKFRGEAIRSHVNSKFNHTVQHDNYNANTIASLIGTFNVWNKNIPDMLRGYFDDMEEVLRRIHKILKKNDYCFIVVANSSYKGIVVPTDLLLADIGNSIGFKVKNIIVARAMNTSSQQIQELKESKLRRESIIFLQK